MHRLLFTALMLFGWTLWVPQKAHSSSLLCARLLSGLATKSPAEINKIQSHLIETGFNRIGNSSHFLSGNIATEVLSNGTVRLYFEQFYWPADWMSRTTKPFESLSAAEGVLAVLPGNGGPRIIDAEMADAPFPKRDLQSPEAKRPMLEQLENAGFQPVPDSPGVYKYSSSKPGRNILAFVAEGKLVRLFEEMSDSKTEQLPEQFRVVDVVQRMFDNGNIREPFSEITFTDGKSNLTITSYGDLKQGDVVRKVIITPMTRQNLGEQAASWPQTINEPQSAFVIGGQNSSDVIKQTRTLNGISISELEGTLRPGQSSAAGFLGKTESLIDVLIADNNYVVGELGLTHQQLADPLRVAQNVWRQQGGRDEVTFNFEGRQYKVKGTTWRGTQQSPFGDKTGTNVDMTVTNLNNNAKVTYSGLVPDMIWRYGFYEGKETPYRVDPKDIVAVFDFLSR